MQDEVENAQADGACLVTGGTQGIGFAIAERLIAERGGAIVLVGRDRSKGEAAARRLGGTGRTVVFLDCDLSDHTQTLRLFPRAFEAVGAIDGLVNCAAQTWRASVADGTEETWDALFATNAKAPFFLMQAMIRHALERGAPAAIVNILSMNAYCGRANLAIYAATKGAVMTLTRNAANAHLRDRIRVNAIAMGWAATPQEQEVQVEVEGKGLDWEGAAAQALPLGRLLTADEVAETACFLLSPRSGLMTGTVIDLEQWVRGAPPPR